MKLTIAADDREIAASVAAHYADARIGRMMSALLGVAPPTRKDELINPDDEDEKRP